MKGQLSVAPYVGLPQPVAVSLIFSMVPAVQHHLLRVGNQLEMLLHPIHTKDKRGWRIFGWEIMYAVTMVATRGRCTITLAKHDSEHPLMALTMHKHSLCQRDGMRHTNPHLYIRIPSVYLAVLR